MKLYRIRIHPEDAPDVMRVFEFSARHTLYDVHAAIQRAFALDDDHLHAFYMSGRKWDKASEIEGPGPSTRGRTPRTRLYELALAPGRRFAYVFDFGDELWHALEVVAVEETEAPPEAPRLVESVGEAPSQDPEEEEEDDGEPPDVSALVPLAQELIAHFPPLAEDEASDDERELGLTHQSAHALELAALVSASELASRLAQELAGDLDRFVALEDAVDVQLIELLSDLPVALADVGRVDEGSALARALAFLDPPHFLGARANILAEAGKREEALAQVAENLEQSGGDTWVQIQTADVYTKLQDLERAEVLLRSIVEQTHDELLRDSALDRLLEVLSKQGRSSESLELLKAERARLDARARDGAGQRGSPKVGRNDPCPCGSGKKHKKCCLA